MTIKAQEQTAMGVEQDNLILQSKLERLYKEYAELEAEVVELRPLRAYSKELEAKAEAYGHAQARVKALEEIIKNMKYTLEIVRSIVNIKSQENY